MAAQNSIAALGEVMQLAYVPSDFDAALRYWTNVMGAGPFFFLPDVALAEARYEGVPTDTVFSMALGYWGNMQIELIRPENQSPSIYRGRYGVTDCLHHICILVDSIDEARARCDSSGAKIVFEAKVGDTGGVIYADPGNGPGNLIELLQPQAGTAALFAMMRAASQGWDGSEPLRSLG